MEKENFEQVEQATRRTAIKNYNDSPEPKEHVKKQRRPKKGLNSEDEAFENKKVSLQYFM
jgi:hypothetical protein